MSSARRSFKTFPASIPEVGAGYWWDPTFATGSGTAAFLLPEMNRKSTHNLVAPSQATAPTVTTINGQSVVSYANGVPDQISRTNDTVTRGFTGAQMFWGWFNFASAPNVTFAAGVILFGYQFAAGDVRVLVHDGVSLKESRFPLPPGGYAAGPFFYEALFVPSESATNRIQLAIDRVTQTPTLAASPGTAATDTAAQIKMGAGTAIDSSISNIAADHAHGVIGITNGIPSSAHRDRLFAYRRLK